MGCADVNLVFLAHALIDQLVYGGLDVSS